MLSCKVTYIVFKVYILSVHAFPGKQTHDLGIASTILECFSYSNIFTLIIILYYNILYYIITFLVTYTQNQLINNNTCNNNNNNKIPFSN